MFKTNKLKEFLSNEIQISEASIMAWDLKIFRWHALLWMHDDRAELINKQTDILKYFKVPCRMWNFFKPFASCYECSKGGLHQIKLSMIPVFGPHGYSDSCAFKRTQFWIGNYVFLLSKLSCTAESLKRRNVMHSFSIWLCLF